MIWFRALALQLSMVSFPLQEQIIVCAGQLASSRQVGQDDPDALEGRLHPGRYAGLPGQEYCAQAGSLPPPPSDKSNQSGFSLNCKSYTSLQSQNHFLILP